MLHLYFEPIDKLIKREMFIRFPSSRFNCSWRPEWVNDPFFRKVIREVDHVDIPDGMATEMACLLKNMRVEDLSTGTKTLMLCRYRDALNRMTMMGKNCYKYLMDIADEKDVYMGCTNYLFFTDEDMKGQQVHFINTNTYVSTAAEFAENVYRMIDNGILAQTSIENSHS